MSDSEHTDLDLRESNPNSSGRHGLTGDMGVSSERVGHTGPGGAWGTDGTRPTSPPPLPDDPAPEQQPGNPEENPVGIPPKGHDPARNPGHSHG
jgi:hypothetical protein